MSAEFEAVVVQGPADCLNESALASHSGLCAACFHIWIQMLRRWSCRQLQLSLPSTPSPRTAVHPRQQMKAMGANSPAQRD
jgi:hypothetical protein